MADTATKIRVSRRLQVNRLHKGTDCPHALKGKGHQLADVTPPRSALTSLHVGAFDDGLEELLTPPVKPEANYVKPNNGSGYYGFYLEDGQLRRTFHCSDAFEYPQAERENIADQMLDLPVDNYDEDNDIAEVVFFEATFFDTRCARRALTPYFDDEDNTTILTIGDGTKAPQSLWDARYAYAC